MFMFVAMGLGNAPNGQYLAPVTRQFGLSRADFSLTFSMRYLFTTIFNLLWLKIFTKIGIRRTVGAGFLFLAAAFFIFSSSSTLPGFYAGGILQGTALALCTSASCSYLVDNWFTERKGTVLGIVFAASGIGGALGNVLVARWIAQNGWRFSYRLTSFLILGIGLGLTLFVRVRRRPENAALQEARAEPSDAGPSLAELRRTGRFYALFAIVFVLGWLCNPVYTIAPAHLVDRGFDPVFAGQMTGLMFIVLGAAKVLWGALYDRFGLRPVFLTSCACGVAALLTLSRASGELSAVAFAVLLGFAMPVETIMVPLLVTNLLGARAYTAMIGVFFALMSAGIAVGNPLINFGYSLAGSYSPVLILYAGLFALCAALYLWCEREAERFGKRAH
ncbi:MAG: MFS transporter [Pyramidobacter sp.]|nr:MFS transporter [Pyramidobacter sp.]MDY3211432.1 MFS transporter [Pyramidobacter sp.]